MNRSLIVDVQEKSEGTHQISSGIPIRDPNFDRNINPIELNTNSATWRCDPRYRNRLKINNSDIPWTTELDFDATEIYWRPSPTTGIYTSACPQNYFDGRFGKNFKMHSLIFGIGGQAVSCQSGFVIFREDVLSTKPVWIAINDSIYGDNSGHITIKLTWK